MFTKNLKCAAVVLLTLTIGSASGRAAPILQYGFDYTSGTVDSQGGAVTDDSGIGNTGYTSTGNGGTYSSDIPTLTQYCTGIGSLSLGGASPNNVHTFDSANTPIYKSAGTLSAMGDVYAAGGLTSEVWMKCAVPITNELLTTVMGNMSLSTTTLGGVSFMSGNTGATPGNVWTHVAGVFTPDAGWTSGDMAGTADLYLNGVLMASNPVTIDSAYAHRGLGVGGHAYDGTWNSYTGLVYEPRISLGVLPVGQFTYAVPEPATATLLLMAVAGLLAYAWRKRK